MSSVRPDAEFQQRARELVLELRAERELSYKELALLLEEAGLLIDAKVLANRVHRGTFDAGFFFALLHALGARQVNFSKPTSRFKPGK